MSPEPTFFYSREKEEAGRAVRHVLREFVPKKRPVLALASAFGAAASTGSVRYMLAGLSVLFAVSAARELCENRSFIVDAAQKWLSVWRSDIK